MNRPNRILAINPGSTSTKIALYEDDSKVFSEVIRHSVDELKDFATIQDQLDFRRDTVVKALTDHGVSLEEIDVFVGRGGGLLPLEGGVYEVTDFLAEHASRGMSGQHPAQLASQICFQFARQFNKRAFVVNPPDVDEFDDIARITGVKGIYRESHVHALNQKEVALRYCNEQGLDYNDVNLIVCHLGGGISITAHRRGRMVDSNDIIKGSGPMTPTRAGDLAYMSLLDLAYSGSYTKKGLQDKLNKIGGLTDHFGTADIRAVYKRVQDGDGYAALVYRAFAYQIAKYIGAMAVALKGNVRAILLTGGLAKEEVLMEIVREYVSWIAEVILMPGEFELEALAAGALRVLRGEEDAKIYSGKPVWQPPEPKF
jgi:butyrate kinase